MNAVSSEDMAAMLRDALADTDLTDEFAENYRDRKLNSGGLSASTKLRLNLWGDRLLFLVAGVAIGGLYVSTFCFEEYHPIGYGPAIVSMAPGISNPVSLFLNQYRQTESQSLSVEAPQRLTKNQRFQRSPEVQEDSSARI